MTDLLLTQANSLHIPLKDQSVHCCVTSPPYLGLRSYTGVEPTCWPGGAYRPVPGAPAIVIPGPTMEAMAACAHVWSMEEVSTEIGRGNWAQGTNGRGELQPGGVAAKREPLRATTARGTCLRCGCWCGTLGNESDVPAYIWHTLLWLRDVRRVLRDDGVAWVVIGDSFAGGPSHAHEGMAALGAQYRGGGHKQASIAKPERAAPGYLQGCLLGIPYQVMLAAMADGWIVRNDCVWAKAACMPESVTGWRWQQKRCPCVGVGREAARKALQAQTGMPRETSYAYLPHGDTIGDSYQPDHDCSDCGGTGKLEGEVFRQGSWRHTRAHETVLMLTKSMGYYANSEAVREEAVMKPQRRSHGHSLCTYDPPGRQAPARGDRGVKEEPGVDGPGGRNPRSVLTPKAASFDGDHYATFPPALIEPLIKATCPERCCPLCGDGWAPVIERTAVTPVDDAGKYATADPQAAGRRILANAHARRLPAPTVHGLHPTCTHYCTCADQASCACGKLPLADWQPGVVLDCFSGSGTTLCVAHALGRLAMGTDLSWSYLATIAKPRLDAATRQGQLFPIRCFPVAAPHPHPHQEVLL